MTAFPFPLYVNDNPPDFEAEMLLLLRALNKRGVDCPTEAGPTLAHTGIDLLKAGSEAHRSGLISDVAWKRIRRMNIRASNHLARPQAMPQAA